MADHVWLRNPETEGVWACPADYAEVAKARGWVATDAPDDSLDGLFDEDAPSAPVADLEDEDLDVEDPNPGD